MIVISDDEDLIVEMKNKTQKRERVIPIACTNMKRTQNLNSEDDVHVIQEVSCFSKRANGLILGSFRTHLDSTAHLSSIRRRVKPDLSVVKSSTMKRTYVPGTLRYISNCVNMRRKLFYVQREQSVRLEERMNYSKLLQSIIDESITSSLIRQTCLPQSFSNPQRQRNVSQASRTDDVQIVDLTSDSENDVIEVKKAPSVPSHEIQVVSEHCDLLDSDVEEISDELEMPGSSKKCVYKENRGLSSTLRADSSSDSDDNHDQCIDLVEEREDQFKMSAAKSSASCEVKDPRGKLEAQMLQQMNIVDNLPEVIDVIDDEQKGVADIQEVGADGDEREEMPKLTEEMEVLVCATFRNKSNEVLVEGFNLVIRPKDIHTLKGNNWLNDEIINFYMSLLMERGKRVNYPSAYCFNTFFYVKLAESGHASLKRWTRKVDIFSYDLVIVPVHLKVHWCLACINFPEKRIEYYDSMGGENEKCCTVLMNYLKDEHQDKKNKAFNFSRWNIVCVEDIPEQLNGSDCGVFVCTYAEYICRLAKFTFTQRDMPYFRVKMAYEILTKKLLL